MFTSWRWMPGESFYIYRNGAARSIPVAEVPMLILAECRRRPGFWVTREDATKSHEMETL